MNISVKLPPLDGGAPTSTRDAAPGATVSLRGVTRSFAAHQVLRGIDLEIPAGQAVAVVGRSGCGKSTLLRLISGLDQPTAGEIAVGGETAGRATLTRVMFQEPRLLPWRRVRANVEIGLPRGAAAERRRAAAAVLVQVGLNGRDDDWPAVLSGGQKQRVALARALAGRPRLLALDEPLGALDALTRLEMRDLIADAWRDKGFTMIIVTHDVTEAVALADRILLIDRGRVAMDIAVDLAWPRRRGGDPRAAAIEGEVLDRLLRLD